MELNNSRLRSSCAFGTTTWTARRAPSLLDVATNLRVESAVRSAGELGYRN